MARDMTAMAYWAGWANAAIPNYDFWLLPCFGILKYNNNGYWTDYSASGNFPYPSSTGPYVTWNGWQNAHGNCSGYARTLLSYGGDANPEFRTFVAEARELDNLAGEIIANVDNYYFCGLELDIEDWWTRSRSVNLAFSDNLIKVVNTVGPRLQQKGKPIAVTVGDTSAGSNTNDAYSGTMKSFYQSEAMAYVAQINIMCYGITHDDDMDKLDALLAEYVAAGVPPDKLSVGIKPEKDGKPDLATVTRLCARLKDQGFGGAFLWGIGLDSMPSSPSASQYVKAMLDGFGLPS
jgi:hypothetical protein